MGLITSLQKHTQFELCDLVLIPHTVGEEHALKCSKRQTYVDPAVSASCGIFAGGAPGLSSDALGAINRCSFPNRQQRTRAAENASTSETPLARSLLIALTRAADRAKNEL